MIFGFLRTVAYIVGVWFIWRWLDRTVGGAEGLAQHSSAPILATPSVKPTTPRKESTWTLKRSRIEFHFHGVTRGIVPQ